jgi:hypothetical protein
LQNVLDGNDHITRLQGCIGVDAFHPVHNDAEVNAKGLSSASQAWKTSTS